MPTEDIAPGPITRLPVELLRRIGEELPLESLAHFAATDKEANRAATYLLGKAREVNHKAGQYVPDRDFGARIFHAHCADIARLPKNQQIKPLLRLVNKIDAMPNSGWLEAIRAAARLGAGMQPEHRDSLGAAMTKKRWRLWASEYMIGVQIQAMHNAGLIPEQDGWVEPPISWRLGRRPEEERLVALQEAIDEVTRWLPDDQCAAIAYLSNQFGDLSQQERMPAFRLLSGLAIELPSSHRFGELAGLRRCLRHLLPADVPEVLALISSHLPSDEPRRFRYAMSLVDGSTSIPVNGRLTVFRAVDAPEMQLLPESKLAVLKIMITKIAYLPEQERPEGFQIAMEQCAALPAEHRLDIVPHLFQEMKEIRAIYPLTRFQHIQALGRGMPPESYQVFLRSMIPELAKIWTPGALEAFQGLMADVRELPPASMADALDAFLTGIRYVPLGARDKAVEDIRRQSEELEPRTQTKLLEKMAGMLRHLPKSAILPMVRAMCGQSLGLVEELRTGVLVALAENIKWMQADLQRPYSREIKKLIPGLPPVWGEEVMDALPEEFRTPPLR